MREKREREKKKEREGVREALLFFASVRGYLEFSVV